MKKSLVKGTCFTIVVGKANMNMVSDYSCTQIPSIQQWDFIQSPAGSAPYGWGHHPSVSHLSKYLLQQQTTVTNHCTWGPECKSLKRHMQKLEAQGDWSKTTGIFKLQHILTLENTLGHHKNSRKQTYHSLATTNWLHNGSTTLPMVNRYETNKNLPWG